MLKLFGLIPPWAYAIAAAVALSGAFYGGWQVRAWKCDAALTRALREAQIAFQAQLERQNDEASEYERERETNRLEGQARETEVRTIYRDRVVPAECEPDAAAVGVLQRALDSANADPAEPGASVRETP